MSKQSYLLGHWELGGQHAFFQEYISTQNSWAQQGGSLCLSHAIEDWVSIVSSTSLVLCLFLDSVCWLALQWDCQPEYLHMVSPCG
jgi:hypothetical protein